ncbi:hypothetical protein KQ876_00805 [Mycoplasma sp. CSL7491-lung]|uniref:hypothetical protein n=1 Tax=Mycoplasma sp. CSL7491-lung TaxID=549718 RepID=UPI001C12723F|nr:hypothetical protein [Mycoplasma sp. CSL7491-lung]MBU4692745.1 hypothetical protein [Mycoplasma sp. CSL7491-lung]
MISLKKKKNTLLIIIPNDVYENKLKPVEKEIIKQIYKQILRKYHVKLEEQNIKIIPTINI